MAKKLNAPVLLVDSTPETSWAALDFIEKNVQPTATIHIIGGTGVIPSSFEAKLNGVGFRKIDRIGGFDRYNTDALIANKLAVPVGTPVVLASGISFPDALSISPIAATKGYPILLTEKDNLSQDIQDFLAQDKPTQIYCIGGSGVISESLVSSIQFPVTRLAGQDRFATNETVLSQFCTAPSTLYVSSGNNFPDALAGSSLAALTGDPIVLIDPSSGLSSKVSKYLSFLHTTGATPSITVFGGTAAVPESVVSKINTVLAGTVVVDPTPEPTTPSVLDNIVDKVQGKVLDSTSFTFNPALDGYYGELYDWKVASDRATNMKALSKLYTLNGTCDTSLYLGSSKSSGAAMVIDFPTDTAVDAVMSTQDWSATPYDQDSYNTQPVAFATLKFFFPTGYPQVYTLIDNFLAGPINIGSNPNSATIRDMHDPVLGVTYVVDGRKIIMKYGKSNMCNTTGEPYGMVMQLTIGKVGQ